MTRWALAAAWAFAAGLLGFSAQAATAEAHDATRESALRRVQFEQMLAFQRARENAPVPRSPYEPMPDFRLPDPKTRFEQAVKALVPPPPTLESLTERAIARTFEQMLGRATGCCPCATAASCDDSLFCNGAEICASGNCASGPAACDDGDPCTIDSCTENTDTCSFTPGQADVARVDVSRGGTGPVATLTWTAVAGATSYNVYRGSSSDLVDLACFQGGVTGISLNDDGAVPAGVFYHLVTSLGCGESSLGTGNPDTRPPAPGCP